ncbi:hypothetical protein BDV93DRAFT_447532 [Ceratobasidium sp. AG-I]|nr:hypothetical protein BDV93DRAFT_447532 [Ceratobasidium sp. AG-I]
MLKTDNSYLSLDFSKKSTELSRAEYSTLVQVRLGHFPTASDLYRFNLTDTPQCTNCYEHVEAIEHYLMNCTVHRAHRRIQDLAVGAESRSLKAWLTPGEATQRLMRGKMPLSS